MGGPGRPRIGDRDLPQPCCRRSSVVWSRWPGLFATVMQAMPRCSIVGRASRPGAEILPRSIESGEALNDHGRRTERDYLFHDEEALNDHERRTEQDHLLHDRVSKYYDKKPVLKDISLSYFYGAKIGVLGLNGSGKSSLLRILAGVDPEFNGETHLSPGNVGRPGRAGAGAGRLEDGAGNRRGRRGGGRGSARRVQPNQREVRRADVGRRDDDAHRAAGRSAGEARRRWTPGTSTRGWRWRWMPCAARPATSR